MLQFECESVVYYSLIHRPQFRLGALLFYSSFERIKNVFGSYIYIDTSIIYLVIYSVLSIHA